MALTKIAATTSATNVLGANKSRGWGGLIFENTDANRCFVLVGDPAIVGSPSSTNYSFSLAQNANNTIIGCGQAIQCIWGTAAGGQLLVSEFIN
jgi:hypothetical protein